MSGEINIEEIERLQEEYENKRKKPKWVTALVILFCITVFCGFVYIRFFNTAFGINGQSIYVKYSTAWIIRYPSEYKGNTLTVIDERNFKKKCPDAKLVYVEDGIEEICLGESDIWAVRLPGSIKNISEDAFYKCEDLRILWFDEAQDGAVIGKHAFARTNLRHVNLPEGVTRIEDGAFSRCAVEKVVLPDSLIYMGDYAFEDCGELEEVTLSSQLEILPNGAFLYCDDLEQLNNTGNLKYILIGALLGTDIDISDIQNTEKICFATFEEYGDYKGIDGENTIYNLEEENKYMSEQTGIPLEVFEEPVDSERIWIDGKYYTMSMSLEEILQTDSWEIKNSESETKVDLYNQRTGNELSLIMDSQGIVELSMVYVDNKCDIVLPGGVMNNSVSWIRAYMMFEAYEDEIWGDYNLPDAYDIKLAGRMYHVSIAMDGNFAGSVLISAK